MLFLSSVSIKRLLHISMQLLLLASWQTLAQEVAIEPGITLKAQNAVKLRAAPPSQKFLFIVGEPGSEISSLKQGDEIKIQEVKEIAVPFGKDIWLKGKTEEGKTGWVYYGNKDQSTNFKNSPKE
jgi:hypothetical protein